MKQSLLIGTVVVLSTTFARGQPDSKARLSSAIDAAIEVTVEKEARRPRPKIPRGSVLFRFRGADLKTEVLPLFLVQVGVKIKYQGTPRILTLKLNTAIGWEEALDLVAQFTNTHITEDRSGNLVLKNRWAGKLDPKEPELEGELPPPRIGQGPRRGNLRYTGKRAVRRATPRRLPRITPKYRPPRQRPPKYNPKYRQQKRVLPKRNLKRVVPKRVLPKRNLKRVVPKRVLPKRNPKYKPPKYRVQ